MTLDDAIYELVSTWPENREVPELLRAAYDKVSGEDKEQVERERARLITGKVKVKLRLR